MTRVFLFIEAILDLSDTGRVVEIEPA